MAQRSAKASPIGEELFRFLEELQQNNDRDWFAENKSRYESEVRQPALELIQQLAVPLRRTAPFLQAIAKKTGGSLMRIYRDTRFGKDKTPYKTNVGISLRHEADRDIHAPGMYLHLATDQCFFAAGCWRPERSTLAAIRAAIDGDPKGWIKTRDHKTFRRYYELTGESLKTSPRDYPKDHPQIEDLRRIDFISLAALSRQQLLAPDVIATLSDRMKAARPLMRFLCDAVEVPY
ncbi:DUF2461 domain-containing protein [Crateriforma conspicua]|uniref:TIGR02453 family protein n=1 Tax=Crateriforma conspicua TaxID=2527996 RepID=A0A5C5YBL6_9PLAN|nr:DUF2461 domain-containing protein [Crateriforma conspicua]TWT72504.1 hypothetical protein Pan14r_48240 [Crateriforma conspicua]